MIKMIQIYYHSKPQFIKLILMRRDNQKKILKWLLNPIDTNIFFEKYYEKNYLLIQDRDSHYYDSIVSVEDIDIALKLNIIPYQKLYLVKDGIKSSINHWATPTPKLEKIELDIEKMLNNLRNGYSLSINGVHNYLAKLKFFTNELNAENNITSSGNIYVTPNTARAFNPHYDRHELFVLQLEGTKHWKIYDMVNEIPDDNFPIVPVDYTKVKLLREVTLKKGDLLYIPRGMAHEATTTDTSSIHLTLSWHAPKMIDILKLMQEKSLELLFFRKSIASTLAETPDIEMLKKDFIAAFHELVHTKSFEEYIKATYEHFQEKKLVTSPRKGLTNFIGKDSLNEDTVIMPRRDLVFNFSREGIFLIVSFSGKKEKFPLLIKNSIEYIFNNEQFMVKDIPGAIPLDYKLTIIKNLLDKDMIEIDLS